MRGGGEGAVLSNTGTKMQFLSGLNKRRLFKVPLLDHLEMSNRKISYVIELCVCALYQKGMTEEGLLRVGCGELRGGGGKIAI